MKILIADDSKAMLAVLSSALHELGHEVIAANNGQEAIEIFQYNRPDLIILDVVMSGIDGFECAKRIRAIDSNDWIPIIFLSASVDDNNISKGIDAGGDDYLTKPFSEITLAAKIKSMQRIADMRKKLFDLTQKLHILSLTDGLTNLSNRMHFDKVIKEKIAEADRHDHIIALLFIDLDKFKFVNDNFGHAIGDLLLQEVAKRLKSCLRLNDFVARIGGDEFAVILSMIESPELAGSVAKKIIHSLSKDYDLDGHIISIGASVGIALYPADGKNKENLIKNADIAMYSAKDRGRNNYQYFTQSISQKTD